MRFYTTYFTVIAPTWLGDLVRAAHGYDAQADPRHNRRPTKKYADGRQKRRR
jgi:hypothetical protein